MDVVIAEVGGAAPFNDLQRREVGRSVAAFRFDWDLDFVSPIAALARRIWYSVCVWFLQRFESKVSDIGTGETMVVSSLLVRAVPGGIWNLELFYLKNVENVRFRSEFVFFGGVAAEGDGAECIDWGPLSGIGVLGNV